MNRERLKEDEIKKISLDTKTTAQLNRATRRIKKLNQTICARSSKEQEKSTPSDNQAEETTRAAPPNTSTPQYFDMTVDDVADEEMHNVDVEAERRKEQEKKKKKQAAEIESRHLVENVRYLPYLQGMSSSSTGPLIYKPMDTEEPRTKDKFKDGSENTIQKRISKKPQEPEPMVVNKEGDQEKRAKKESASERKKRRTKEEE